MMRKNLLCLVFALAAFGVAASTATAGELSVKIANGRATIIAKDVPVRQILAEWAKVGETKILNGEKVAGGPVTLELVDVPEKEALDVLLRTAAGYITAPRPANLAGASQFDRVIVLATSRAPAATTSLTPPPFGNRAGVQMPPPPQLPPDDDDGEPGDQGPNAPPIMGPNGPMPAFPGRPERTGRRTERPGHRPGRRDQRPERPHHRRPERRADEHSADDDFTAGTAAAAGATAAAGSQSVRDAEPAWPHASSPWWGEGGPDR